MDGRRTTSCFWTAARGSSFTAAAVGVPDGSAGEVGDCVPSGAGWPGVGCGMIGSC